MPRLLVNDFTFRTHVRRRRRMSRLRKNGPENENGVVNTVE